MATLKQRLQGRWMFPSYCCALLCTDIIPRFGGIDVMGAQWLYLAIVNVLFLLLFYFSGLPFKRVNNGSVVLFAVFLLFGVVSMTTAVNRVESTVILSRYIIIFFAILFVYQTGDLSDKNVRRFVGWCVTLVCLIESLAIIGLVYFKAKSSGFHNVNLHDLMLSGTAFMQGNRNIAATNLAQKLPFILLLIFDESTAGRIAGYSALFLSAVTITILGSISAAGGLIFLVLLLNVWAILHRAKAGKYFLRLFLLDALLLILFLSTSVVLKKISGSNVRNYAGLAHRVAGKMAGNFDSERRKLMLRQGWQYVKTHPFSGCGIGDWKIVAISFDRYLYDDFRIAKHVHNDFMETAAETGVGGGLVYVALFVFLGYTLVKYSFGTRAVSTEPANQAGVVLLGSLGAYIIDALFNFPAERPCSGVNLSLVIGLAASLPAASFIRTTKPGRNLVFCISGVLSLAVLYSTSMVFRSMRYQEYFKDDVWLPHPRLTAADVNAGLPDYPDLTEYAIPVNCIKARYYLLDSQDNEGLRHIRSAKDANPNLALGADLMAEYYAAKANYDLSFFYARKAITAMPRCRLYVKVFLFDCLAKGDSNAIRNYFKDLITHSPKSLLATDWEHYCVSYYQCTHNAEMALALLDTASLACPGNPRLVALQHRITDERQRLVTFDSVYTCMLDEGKKNYAQGNYDAAVASFTKAAALAPDDGSNYENLGLVYFQKRDFVQSVFYFKKVIDLGKSQDGRAAYFCARAFYKLSNWREACKYATAAADKNYPGAVALTALITRAGAACR